MIAAKVVRIVPSIYYNFFHLVIYTSNAMPYYRGEFRGRGGRHSKGPVAVLLLSGFSSVVRFQKTTINTRPIRHALRVTVSRRVRPFHRPSKILLRALTSPFRHRTRRHVLMRVRSRLCVIVLRNSLLRPTFRRFPRRKIRRLVWMLFRLLPTSQTMSIRRRRLILLRLIRRIRGHLHPNVRHKLIFRHLYNIFSRSPIRRVMSVLRIMMRHRTISPTVLHSVISHSLIRKFLRRRLFRQYFRDPLYHL